MFSKSERICLSDANEHRFLSVSFSREKTATADLPGPAHYTPAAPLSTQRFTFLRGKRRAINAEMLKNRTPAPGTYDPKGDMGVERSETHEQRVDEFAEKNAARKMIYSRRTPRYMNMINVNNQHGLKEYACTARGPGEYELPRLWRCTDRSHQMSPSSPAANMAGASRSEKENLDGKSFVSIEALPGPGDFPVPPPPRPRGGVMSTTPRDMHRAAKDLTPGPGRYAPALPSSRLGTQITATPRRLNDVVCGIDLRKHKHLPGPGSYHPIFNTIVKQEYTV